MDYISFKQYMAENSDVILDQLIYDYINNYPTWSEYGFIPEETARVVSEIKDEFPWDEDKWNDAMMGNTGMIIEGKFITYHCDIITGILCAIENRNMKLGEFD